jgi:leucine dehydrogenase
VKYLIQQGAVVTVSDIDTDKVKNIQKEYPSIKVVNPDDILFTECDVLAPCALGAVINDQTIQRLKCKIVAGGANNQLAEPKHGEQLKELGILYAPDYVINAGGLMNVFVELEGYSHERAFEKTKRVFDNCWKVFEIAKRENIPTHLAADRLAEMRINSIGHLRRRHPGRSERTFTTLREVFKR